MSLTRVAAVTAVASLSCAVPALAEVQLSFYLGAQEAAHSRVRGNDPGGIGDFSFLSEWRGLSFEAPPYYGVRAIWWRSDRWGFGVDVNHTKVYATDQTRADNGFSTLEFTDGLNIVTANVFYRWTGSSRFTPYVGGGLGVSIPHVEVTTSGGRTFKYEYGGPAVALIAGLDYRFSDRWSVFTEYKGVYSHNAVDLDNGGDLRTNIVTSAVNFGVSYHF